MDYYGDVDVVLCCKVPEGRDGVVHHIKPVEKKIESKNKTKKAGILFCSCSLSTDHKLQVVDDDVLNVLVSVAKLHRIQEVLDLFFFFFFARLNGD